MARTPAGLTLLLIAGLGSVGRGQETAILSIEARIVGEASEALTLSTGSEYRLEVTYVAADGWSAADGGLPQPILQLDVPSFVELGGDALDSHRELARNEFLRFPFEQLFEDGRLSIPFVVRETPVGDAAIEFNVLAYLGNGADSRFLRHRYSVPLQMGGAAEAIAADRSQWGRGLDILQLGDLADSFALPTAAGETVDVNELLGEHYVLVTTYRAFW